MKKLISVTTALLLCATLLTMVPQVWACEEETPVCTEETAPDTVQPCDLPDMEEDET